MQKFIEFVIRFKEYITLVSLVIICFCLISMGDVTNIGGFRSVLVGTFGWFREAFSFIPNTGALKNENKALRDLNLQLSQEVTRMRKSLLENENLKEMLNLKQKNEFEYVSADVVGRTTIEMRNYMMVNKGSSSGVQDGMAVRTAAGIAGLVIGTTKNYALIESLQNREIKVSSKVLRSSIDGLLVWEGGNDYLLKNVPKSFDIKVGDVIVTSDFSSRFPKDIPVGVVEKLSEEAGDLFLKIYVRPAAEFSAVEQVFVIKYLPDPERQKLVEEIDELLKARKNISKRK
jgi:rod shape-determining protein MreC